MFIIHKFIIILRYRYIDKGSQTRLGAEALVVNRSRRVAYEFGGVALNSIIQERRRDHLGPALSLSL